MKEGDKIQFIKSHYVQESYAKELPDNEKINIIGRVGLVTEILGESFIAKLEGDDLPTLFLNSCLDKIKIIT